MSDQFRSYEGYSEIRRRFLAVAEDLNLPEVHPSGPEFAPPGMSRGLSAGLQHRPRNVKRGRTCTWFLTPGIRGEGIRSAYRSHPPLGGLGKAPLMNPASPTLVVDRFSRPRLRNASTEPNRVSRRRITIMDRKNSSTVTSLKTQAKLLRQALADEGIELGHVKCLHAVARSHGYKNWNAAREAGGLDYQAAFDIFDALDVSPDHEERSKPRVVEWEPLRVEEFYVRSGEPVETAAVREARAQEFLKEYRDGEADWHGTVEEQVDLWQMYESDDEDLRDITRRG